MRALRSTVEWIVRKRVTLFGCGLILLLIICCVNLCSALYTSRVTLYLNYPRATEGLYPNGMRFNIYEIKSSEVMERAIAYAGLTGQVAPEALADCLRVRNGSTTSASGSSNFICTSYSITFTDRIGLRGRSANTMIALVCKAYKDYFIEHYTDNQVVLSITDPFFETDEYLMQIDLIQIKANQLLRYVGGRLRENKNYGDPVSGLSFSALNQQLTNFLKYNVSNLSSYVLESGIANDKADLMAILDYKTRMNTLSYDRAMAAYTVDNEGISIYDKTMSAIVMIPTTDSGLKYYMSRTRTGMDYLAAHADEQLAAATQTQAVIEYDEYVSEKMRAHEPTRAQRQKADEMIGIQWAYLEKMAAQIQQVDNAFIRQNHREYISFRSNALSFKGMIDLSSAIVDALLMMFGLLLLRLVYDLFRLRKRKGAGMER